jgi:hypothetical protein
MVSTPKYIIQAESKVYLGHNGLSRAVFDIAERHLGTLMLIDHDLRVVNVLNFLQWH